MWSATKHRSDLLHHKPNNTHSQLNRWIRCHSAERCQTFYNEGWWQFADWQAVSSDVINTTSDKITTVKWSLDLSSKANEVRAFGNVPTCSFSGLIWVKSWMCVTRNWNVDRKRSNNCILMFSVTQQIGTHFGWKNLFEGNTNLDLTSCSLKYLQLHSDSKSFSLDELRMFS